MISNDITGFRQHVEITVNATSNKYKKYTIYDTQGNKLKYIFKIYHLHATQNLYGQDTHCLSNHKSQLASKREFPKLAKTNLSNNVSKMHVCLPCQNFALETFRKKANKSIYHLSFLHILNWPNRHTKTTKKYGMEED